MQIEILNPKALGILEELAKLELIRISDDDPKSNDFQDILNRLRSKSNAPISDKTLASEVEIVRSSRYSAK